MKRPIVRDKTTAILVGGALVVAGFTVLYDAWEGRGQKSPWYLGPVLPW